MEDEESFIDDETSDEQVKVNLNIISTCAIIISVGMILTAGYLIYNEISNAKTSCEELNFEYEFKFPSKHFCNNKTFFKYNTGWDFEKEIGIIEVNISELKFP